MPDVLAQREAETARPVGKMSGARKAYDVGGSEEEALKGYLPLVQSVVQRMKVSLPSHVEVEDLLGVGLVGLIQAFRRFNPAHGTSFTSFATTRIRGAVLDELRRSDWMSRSARSKAKKLSEVIISFEQRHGRPSTEEEIASEMGLSVESYAALLDEVKPVCYLELDASMGDGEIGSLHEVIADDSQSTASEQIMKKELVQLVVERLQNMPETARKVLAMYYFENMRLAEIAEVFGVTESRICQIHTQAVLSLRAFLQTAQAR